MPDSFSDVEQVTNLIDDSALPPGSGTDYEYQHDYYLEMLKAQLEAMKQQYENWEREQEEEGLFGTKNMDRLNTLLSIRGATESFRDSYVNKKIQMQGGFHTMEDPNKPGSGRTMDNSQASWKFKEGNFLNNALEIGLGWNRGIEAVDGQTLAQNNDVLDDGELVSVDNKYNPDSRILSYAVNSETGEMDAYYTDDDGTVHWRGDKGNNVSSNNASSTNNNTASVDDSSVDSDEEIVLNGTLVDNNSNVDISNSGVDIAESNDPLWDDSLSYTQKDHDRALKYISEDWMPDESVNKDAYMAAGGRHTAYWDNKDTVETSSTETISEGGDKVKELNTELLAKYQINEFENTYNIYEQDSSARQDKTYVDKNLIDFNSSIKNNSDLFTGRLDINKLDDGGFELNYGATDSMTFDNQKDLNTFLTTNNLTNYSSNF